MKLTSTTIFALLATAVTSAKEGTTAMGHTTIKGRRQILLTNSDSPKDAAQPPPRLLLQHSVLLEKPNLLLDDIPKDNGVAVDAKNIVPMAGSYNNNDDNDNENHDYIIYQPFSKEDAEKHDHAKRIVSQLQDSNNDHHNHNHNNHHRQLILNGHIADILLGGCNAGEVYDQTNYDDTYQPACTCFEDQTTGQLFMECSLGDDTCSSLMVDNVCSGTHEVFFFAESDGDLTSKATCTVCKSDNCEGVTEICTSVGFNDDFEPAVCRVVKLASSETTADNTTIVTDSEACLDCVICGDGTIDNPYGVEHTCFDKPSVGCDTNSFAHLHNFLPGSVGSSPVPGDFSNLCSAPSSMERSLYTYVNYDRGYSTLCDCDDPTSGAITCDLHNSQCFANLCTDISEVFFFDRATGDYEAKWTINWDTSLWTQTRFDPTTGRATGCSVLDNDPQSGELVQCTQCTICQSAQEGAGVSFDCFGIQQFGCDTTDGRAKYNFYIEEDATIPSRSNAVPKQEDNDTLPFVLGALFGGMAVAFLIVVAVRQRTPAANSNNNNASADDMTVGSSVAPSAVGGEGPLDQDLQFTIDGDDNNNNNNNNNGPSTAPGDDENPAASPSIGESPSAETGIMA